MADSVRAKTRVTVAEFLPMIAQEVFRHDLQGYGREIHPKIPDTFPCPLVPQWACEILSPTNTRRDPDLDGRAVRLRLAGAGRGCAHGLESRGNEVGGGKARAAGSPARSVCDLRATQDRRWANAFEATALAFALAVAAVVFLGKRMPVRSLPLSSLMTTRTRP